MKATMHNVKAENQCYTPSVKIEYVCKGFTDTYYATCESHKALLLKSMVRDQKLARREKIVVKIYVNDVEYISL